MVNNWRDEESKPPDPAAVAEMVKEPKPPDPATVDAMPGESKADVSETRLPYDGIFASLFLKIIVFTVALVLLAFLAHKYF